MKPRSQTEENKQWVRSALKLYNTTIRTRFEVDQVFPHQEFLRQFSTLDAQKKFDMRKFLNFDTSRLPRLADIEELLVAPDSAGEESGEIVYFQLREVYSKAIQLRNMVLQFGSCTHKTYPEAKSLLAKILQLGVWMEEADIVSRIIRVNKQVDLQGEDIEPVYPHIRELFEPRKQIHETPIRKDYSSKGLHVDELQRKIDTLLWRPCLDMADLANIKSLRSKAKEIGCHFHGLDRLDELCRGFSLIERLSKIFNLHNKGLTLMSLVTQLCHKIAQAVYTSEFGLCEDVLRECRDISYSLSPISQLLQEVKIILLSKDAEALLSADQFTVAQVEALLGRVSPALIVDIPKLATLNKMLREANEWKSKITKMLEEVGNIAQDRIEASKPHLNQVLYLESKLVDFQSQLSGNLDKLEDLGIYKSKLLNCEFVFKIFKLLMKVKSGDKMELNNYLEMRETSKLPQYQDYANYSLLEKFRQLSTNFGTDYLALKTFSQKLEKEAHKVPLLYESDFLDYVRELKRLDTLTAHITKLEKVFFLGDFGFSIKDYLSRYRKVEGMLLSIVESKPLTWLEKANLQEVEVVIKEFQAKKQNLVIRVYSTTIEDLARYEWVLKVIELLKQKKPRLDSLEKLEKSSSAIRFNDRNILDQLIRRKETSQTFRSQTEQLLDSKTIDLERLRVLKSEIDSHNVSIPSTTRRVNNELLDAEFVLDEVREIEQRLLDHTTERLVTLADLLLLLKQIKGLACKLPEVELKIKRIVSLCEKVRNKLISCVEIFQQRPSINNEQINTSIQEYIETGVVIQELEILLARKREANCRLEIIRAEDLAGKSFHELTEIENWIRESLNSKKGAELWDLVLKRKLKLLLYLSAQSTKLSSIDHTAEGVLRKEELDTFIARLSGIKGVSEEEISILANKREKADLYLTQIIKYSQENLKKCSKTLFNFLDVSPEIKKAIEERYGKTTQLENKEDTLDVTLEGRRILKEHLKELRKNTIKKLADNINTLLHYSSKVDGRDLAIALRRSSAPED